MYEANTPLKINWHLEAGEKIYDQLEKKAGRIGHRGACVFQGRGGGGVNSTEGEVFISFSVLHAGFQIQWTYAAKS